MITFSDILKGKFLEEFSAISINDMLVAIALSFVLSLFIVYIYRNAMPRCCVFKTGAVAPVVHPGRVVR